MNAAEWFVMAWNYSLLVYILFLNAFMLLLYVCAVFAIRHHNQREIFLGLSDLALSNHTTPVSVIVPAYCEEATILSSVKSFLSLRYPVFEIVVVNDGSRDSTLTLLVDEFNLFESDQPVRNQLRTKPIRAVYASASEPLIVIDKVNGGKADALNVGICAASYPLVCCIDADIILDSDALLRLARPLVESEEVVAVGGIVRVANGCEVEAGRISKIATPRSPVANLQIVEYLRAFLVGRTGWAALNALLIISGAFGMFRRQTLIDVGGYASDSVGEDMEIVARIHRQKKEHGEPYKITFIPDPVSWTEAPATLRVLRRQRDRWHRGLMDTLIRHRKMLLNPRYGTVGMLAMPYYFLFEFAGPIVEILGYVVLVTSYSLGFLDFWFAVVIAMAAIGLGVLLSVAAILLEEMRLNRYPRWYDIMKLTFYAISENFGYRQLSTFWRAWAIVSFLRKSKAWGDMERKGFQPPPPAPLIPLNPALSVKPVVPRRDNPFPFLSDLR